MFDIMDFLIRGGSLFLLGIIFLNIPNYFTLIPMLLFQAVNIPGIIYANKKHE